jgi:predicted DNA-binding transcriptional regulator AlpA
MSSPKFSVRLTVQELADRWQKSDKWIYSNYRRIGLKVLPIGQHLRFPLEEVEAWEQSHLR